MDMPHLVMTQILDNVGFLDMLNLRKTCKTFRNFIDDVKPNNDLKKVNIRLGHKLLTVDLVLETNGIYESFFVTYQIGPKDNCYLVYKNEPEFAEKRDGHFLEAFLNDFEPILKNQRSKLTDLEIKINSFAFWLTYSYPPLSKFQSIFSRFLCSDYKERERFCEMAHEINNHLHLETANEMIARLEQILKSRTVPLNVENLDLTVFKSSQIFGILRFIKANSFKAFQANFDFCNEEDPQVLDLIQKCQTLKSLEYLEIQDFSIKNSISDFLDIPELSIWRHSSLREDTLILKQAFLTNHHLKKWELKYQTSKDYNILYEVLGDIPYNPPANWFFRIPNSEEVLSISVSFGFGSISFTRIILDDVSGNELIL
ncbi:hypothetical protein B9Z55_026795 [Caenorhabditis nigoni]|nr:hypothetical protein B9Z55_026795 [Caenorhabditis nigoni]